MQQHSGFRPSVSSASTRALLPAGAVLVALSFGLAGCVSGGPGPHPSSARPVSAPTASAPAASSLPALVPGGTAAQNLPFFDQVNRATLAANPNAKGRDFIDALVAAGFTKADMQVTVDTTTIGLKANSIQFSVRMGETCLIGQNGADAGGYNSAVTPVLATGTCLIGDTRPIDW
jgi:hypothetical protein